MSSHPLNPDVAKLVAELNNGTSIDLADPEQFAQFRTNFDAGVDFMRGGLDTSKFNVVVRDEQVPGRQPVPIRTYIPLQEPTTNTVLLYMHGGGWNVGGLDTLDPELRWFTERLGCTIVSVDYRLAPEHPYPAAFNDCMSVLHWVTTVHPNARIAVAGDSSGGNLAAAVAIAATRENIPVVAQLLLNPALDASQSGTSHAEYAEGYLLTRAGMEFNWSAYLSATDDWTSDLASPSQTRDLAGLPPAVVVTAGYDPLRDDGVDYVERLRGSGVRCEHLHLPGMAHGFVVMSGRVPAVNDIIEQFLYHFARLLRDSDAHD